MSRSGARGELRQPRLGTLQQRVMGMLYHQWQEGQTPEAKAMAQADLMGSIYDYAVWKDRQWLPMVYTQSLVERGQTAEATDILLRSLWRIVDLRRESLNEALKRYEDPESPSGKLYGSDAAFLHSVRLAALTARRQYNQVRMLKEVTHEEDFSEQERYMLAGQLAIEIVRDTGLTNGDFLLKETEALPPGGAEVARTELAKRQAALSRAVKLLIDHGLIERCEIPWRTGATDQRSALRLTGRGVELLEGE